MALIDMNSNKNKQLHTVRREGFTLVEMIVAFSIFTIFITVAAGSFVRSVRIQRVSLQLMAINDNMAITMEQMMREMRVGYNFCTAESIPNTLSATVQSQCASMILGQEIQFFKKGDVPVRYRRTAQGSIQKGVGVAEDEPIDVCAEGESVDGICYRTITAENTDVMGANFQVLHNDVEVGLLYPPRIVLSFSITSTDPLVKTMTSPITIQTTISARCGKQSCPADN
ncbi:MAG: hypothetical protein UT41_C0001G0270 [Candidatus Wolfebacteria bacterium GW2011_GWC2_39_22]|uniref:Type II secretion system protein n=1 Tax=Candidatus Wolfebacteria bacterium GW2011_GWC2_39_22 TaxID=1619013 RepID=A0A0G0NIT8_9BACT|nr:MAG: hypothetical protein UT41_C0001G0270 [Candidatus Wolfebacteria bacterium GW2011_GWC2_39_22]HBI25612.1 hypothetical protein [Candidatus Wolfebacteria bacterium]